MTNEKLEALKQYVEKVNASKSEVCPSCGHCPTCGRGGHHVAPWVIPMPYYPQPYPHYHPWGTWVTCETATALPQNTWTAGTASSDAMTPNLTYTGH